MADGDERGPGVSSGGAERRAARETKAAAALRANLRKRKAQRRERESLGPAQPDAASGEVEGATSGGSADQKGPTKGS